MSWRAQNRSKDAKNPSVAGVWSQKPEPDCCPVQPYICSAGEYGIFGQCGHCQPVLYQDTPGKQTMCKRCASGKFTDTWHQSSCKNCDANQNTENEHLQEVCSNADALKNGCRAGSYRGVVSCRDCPRGYYSKDQSAYECAGCEAGKFSDVSANNHGCEYCPAGKFSFGEKNTYCSGCSVGQSSNSVVGQSACTSCQVGYFAPRQAMPNCLHPKHNSVVNKTGSSSSVACPANSLVDESFTSCNARGASLRPDAAAFPAKKV
jgi:hypothetical protein